MFIEWFLPSANVTDVTLAPLIILQAGRLSLHQDGTTLELADGVEYCWLQTTRIGPLHNAVWAVTATGVSLWINLLLSKGSFSRQQLNIALDFVPLGVRMDTGIIVGVEQYAVTRHEDGGAHFAANEKSQLFIHHVILDMLRRGQDADALSMGEHYAQYDYFGHSMEQLLHGVLDEEVSGGTGGHKMLSRVIAYLRQFPRLFYRVVVRCTRKSEVSMWHHLFAAVGDVQQLFGYCLDQGDLKTAA